MTSHHRVAGGGGSAHSLGLKATGPQQPYGEAVRNPGAALSVAWTFGSAAAICRSGGGVEHRGRVTAG